MRSIVPGASPRTDGEHCAEYVLMLAGTDNPLPPIIVHRPTRTVIDGNLRLRAAIAVGRTTIPVHFFDGSAADAFALAVYANVRHGIPLSLAERKTAAERLLLTHPEWSDRSIAATSGLSHKTVSAQRRRASGENAQSHMRWGKDGRLRPTDTSAGRLAAARILRENPRASLREVSKHAGVSPGTVRDVRERLKRSEHPVPQAVRNRPSPSASRNPVPTPPADEALAVPIQQTLLRSLRSDPALKFNERGRVLLRSLAHSAIDLDQWTKMTTDAPDHCRATLAKLARANAESWSALAARLETHGIGADIGRSSAGG
ncbi:winged helix-turn-helix transcriptional regulator [Nocardia sp. 2]|uniref:Winged helix-turn-helix transcriptional regulator n=1 Tax=Nocardia acididurans TaxID=2802282 RepID=A0ABS1MFH9_9NOCA|nr:winged helix-turn-helix transcriptional regulator [Nocardia acididurans]MBL1078825.1 winged helix-turn-helix transcriptional regulator [Nocardia acididurans]